MFEPKNPINSRALEHAWALKRDEQEIDLRRDRTKRDKLNQCGDTEKNQAHPPF